MKRIIHKLFKLVAFTVFAVNANTFHLELVDSVWIDTVNTNIIGVSLSGDDNNLYAVNNQIGKISWFTVDKLSGDLTKGADYTAIDSFEIKDVKVSPNGKFVYATHTGYSDTSVVIFSRNTTTGEIGETVQIGRLPYNRRSYELTIGPKGRSAYVFVGNDVLAKFAIDTASGEFTYVDTLSDMNNDLVFSPGGEHAYIPSFSDDCIKVYSINSTFGYLSLDTIMQGDSSDTASLKLFDTIEDIVISKDGKSAYTASWRYNRIGFFSRNTVTGRLTLEKHYRIQQDFWGKGDCEGMVISDDDTKLIIAGGSGYITWFNRDIVTGSLTYEGNKDYSTIYDGGPQSIDISSDGKFVYASIEGAVASFAVDTTETIRITYPQTGDTLYNGTDVYIEWDKLECEKDFVYLILLDDNENVVDTITDEITSNDGSFKWFIPWELSEKKYKLKVMARSSWEYDITGTIVIDTCPTPDKIIDDNKYYEGKVVANNSDVTTDVGSNQITLNHGNIYTVYKRGVGSAVADRQVKVAVIDKDGNVVEKDITVENNESVSDPVIASTQSSVVAMYHYFDGNEDRLCVARSTDRGNNFTITSLGDIEPDALLSDGVSRYYIRDGSFLNYSLDDGKNFTYHQQFDDLDFSTYTNLHVDDNFLWTVSGVSTDSILVYRADKSNLVFERVAGWYVDMPSSWSYKSAAEENKCVVYYEHEEVGTYYLRMREINGTSLGSATDVSVGSSSSFSRDIELFLDNDTLYSVASYGTVTRYFNGSFEDNNVDLNADIQESNYSSIGDVYYKGNGIFYGYTDLTATGSKNNLTVWYWNYNQQSPVIPDLNSKPIKFSLNTYFLKGSSNLQLIIGIPEITNSKLAFKLFNMSGRLVKSENFEVNKTGWYRESMNVGGISSGMYLMRMQHGSKVLNKPVLLRR